MITAIKELHAQYVTLKDFHGKFHFYVQDRLQYVILKMENCPYDLIDRYRAERFCKKVHGDRTDWETHHFGPNKTSIEETFYAIKATRVKLREVMSAGKISFGIASALATTDDPHDLNYGYIPSIPPFTVPKWRFETYLQESVPTAEFVSASSFNTQTTEIASEDVYDSLMLELWTILLGWVRCEGIDKTYGHFRRQLMTREIVEKVLLYLKLEFTNIDEYHDKFFDSHFAKVEGSLLEYFGEGRSRVDDDLQHLHYDPKKVADKLYAKVKIVTVTLRLRTLNLGGMLEPIE